MTKDRITGVVALLIGAVMVVMTLQLPESSIVGDVGPTVFPFISAGMLLICGIGLLITGKKQEKSIFTADSLKRLAFIFVVVLLYCVAMNYLGFLVPTAVVLFVLCTMFAENMNVPWWHRLIFAVAVAVAVYLLFHNVLSLKLPTNQLF